MNDDMKEEITSQLWGTSNFMDGTWDLTEKVFAGTVIALILYPCLVWLVRRLKGMPPGPVNMPIVGYLPFLSIRPYKDFAEMKEKYGPVFGLTLGRRYIVILGDHEAITEAFNKEAFNGRPPDNGLSVVAESDVEGFGDMNGYLWREHRKFAMHILKDLDIGKTSLEESIKEEVSSLVKLLSRSNGQPTNLKPLLSASASNNICSLVFGKRWEYDHHARIYLDSALNDVVKYAGKSAVYVFFPMTRWILKRFKLFSYDKLQKAVHRIITFIKEEVRQHEETVSNDNVRDYIDAYLLERRKLPKDQTSAFSLEVLVGNVAGFFGAGTESTRTTAHWCLLVAATFPEVSERVRKEIDDVIGREKFPAWKDRLAMPYTMATIMEVLRWKTVLPLNDFRYTTENTSVKGYFIPKGTWVLANLWGIHHDPDAWEDPMEFRPDRFLSEDGENVIKPPAYVPFTLGKRSCPGETMGYVEVFLYFTAILQAFDVKLPQKYKDSAYTDEFGITLQPREHQLQFLQRGKESDEK